MKLTPKIQLPFVRIDPEYDKINELENNLHEFFEENIKCMEFGRINEDHCFVFFIGKRPTRSEIMAMVENLEDIQTCCIEGDVIWSKKASKWK